nr:hypothetical protein [uncultured Acidovorax sp.]
MEIDLSLFAQQMSVVSVGAGFLGGCLYSSLSGFLMMLGERLHARDQRLERIAQARIRQQAILRAMPRG